jgi:hypothetical protein
MKIYSNGKDRVLTGNFPAHFKLLKDGVGVPFLRTSQGSIRLSGAIPEGELEIQEFSVPKAQKKQDAKNILDQLYLSIISEADFDRMQETQGSIQKIQGDIAKKTDNLEKRAKELIERENLNAESILQTSTAMKEMAKAFGQEIQADRDEIIATANRIKQDIQDSADIIGGRLSEHESAINPHKITKKTVGLDKVDNTSDEDKPISKATQKALDKKADKKEVEDVAKALSEASKKQDKIVKGIEKINWVGGVGGNELPSGGKSGQALLKASNKDGDYKWGDVDVDLSDYVKYTDIVSSVSSSSTNSQAVGAKLFYDTVGNIENILHNINSGS